LPPIELSAAQAFRGWDVPDSVLAQCAPADAWKPQLAAGTLWIVDDAGPVAFLAASRHGKRLHIDEVDVDLAHQRQGLGRRLIGEAIAWARRSGVERLSLTTFRNIPWNAPFYASLGFVEWEPDQAPATIRQALAYEAARGLTDRCAMTLDL
jgi:GNAT superfamily N-acetyltransferase